MGWVSDAVVHGIMWTEHTFPCGCWYFTDSDGRARNVEVCKACLERAFRYLSHIRSVKQLALDMGEEEGYTPSRSEGNYD